jgi:hypothetical protein
MKEVADALVDTGMVDAGYDMVNVVCNGWGPRVRVGRSSRPVSVSFSLSQSTPPTCIAHTLTTFGERTLTPPQNATGQLTQKEPDKWPTGMAGLATYEKDPHPYHFQSPFRCFRTVHSPQHGVCAAVEPTCTCTSTQPVNTTTKFLSILQVCTNRLPLWLYTRSAVLDVPSARRS